MRVHVCVCVCVCACVCECVRETRQLSATTFFRPPPFSRGADVWLKTPPSMANPVPSYGHTCSLCFFFFFFFSSHQRLCRPFFVGDADVGGSRFGGRKRFNHYIQVVIFTIVKGVHSRADCSIVDHSADDSLVEGVAPRGAIATARRGFGATPFRASPT